MLDSPNESMRELSEEGPLSPVLEKGDRGVFFREESEGRGGTGIRVIISDPQFLKRETHFEGQKCHEGKRRVIVEDCKYGEKENQYTGTGKKELEYKGAGETEGEQRREISGEKP
jgi:hypothetical protein